MMGLIPLAAILAESTEVLAYKTGPKIGSLLNATFGNAVDLILLAAGIYHALNGLRMVLMDYWFGRRKLAVGLNIVLWIFGLAAAAYGAWALWPWIGYQVG